MKKNRNETQANLTKKRITFRKRQNDTENQAKKSEQQRSTHKQSRSPPAGARTVAPRAPRPIPTSPLSRAWFPGIARLYFWLPSSFIS